MPQLTSGPGLIGGENNKKNVYIYIRIFKVFLIQQMKMLVVG
jgi:hypothetical protein